MNDQLFADVTPLTKRCSACRERFPLDAFHRDASREHLDGKQNTCANCIRDYNRLRRYGISRAQYDHLVSAQNGACAGCLRPYAALPLANGRSERLYVDHDHATGKVRGLLCMECNTILGLAHDDPVVLERLDLYLTCPPACNAFWPEEVPGA